MQQFVTAVTVVGTKVGTLPTIEGHPFLSRSEYTKLGRMAAPVIIFLKVLGSNTFLALRSCFFGGGAGEGHI